MGYKNVSGTIFTSHDAFGGILIGCFGRLLTCLLAGGGSIVLLTTMEPE